MDPDDYANLEACLDGPDTALALGCDCFDQDADNDVDLLDFALFMQEFLGRVSHLSNPIGPGACVAWLDPVGESLMLRRNGRRIVVTKASEAELPSRCFRNAGQ